MRKNHWISFAIAVLVAVSWAGLEERRDHYFLTKHPNLEKRADYTAAFFMQRLEWAMQDARFKVREKRKPHPDIVIIGIDDESLKALHQWPWPRRIHARLIRALEKTPPKALLFDIFFIDPFTSDLAGDKELVRATQDNPWVIHSFYCDLSGDQVLNKTMPIPALTKATSHTGFVNAVIDEDGTLRNAIPELDNAGTRDYLLSVLGAALYLGKSPEDLVATLPRDAQGHYWVNYVGPESTFVYVPYVDVLKGDLPASELAGKVVLVGARATGTYDHYPTPLSKNMPGVEFHANIIDNLLRGDLLRYGGIRWTYLAIAIFGIFCGVFLARFSAWAGALWAIVVAVAYSGLAQWLFVKRSLMIDMAGPLLVLAVGYVAIVIYRFFTEEREKRWVKAAFGQYVSPKVLDILMEDPTKLKLVGERRDMTVFFSDVAGFTTISERMNPDELVVLLNRYLSAMTEVIFEYDGYLNKYMGDGIMAFWNAPVKQADHAERACRCALKSMRRLKELNEELKVQGLNPLGARIGINSGTMVVGNMGSQQKSDYTVMGDNVNTGSRLEGANKAFGSSIMISEFTYEIVQDKFEVRFLDRIRVPGKAKPVKVYELLTEKGGLSPEWQKAVPLYHDAIELFTHRKFVEAREKFLEVSGILGQDKASLAYVGRVEAFLAAPPAEDWDGVYEVKSK
jgi:adenylate cyclase